MTVIRHTTDKGTVKVKEVLTKASDFSDAARRRLFKSLEKVNEMTLYELDEKLAKTLLAAEIVKMKGMSIERLKAQLALKRLQFETNKLLISTLLNALEDFLDIAEYERLRQQIKNSKIGKKKKKDLNYEKAEEIFEELKNENGSTPSSSQFRARIKKTSCPIPSKAEKLIGAWGASWVNAFYYEKSDIT